MQITIEDVYYITGRGVVVTAKLDTIPPIGQTMQLIRPGRETWERQCIGVESFAVQYNEGQLRPVGLLFRGVKKGELESGDKVVFSKT